MLKTLAAHELSKEELALLQSTSMLGQAITLDLSRAQILCVCKCKAERQPLLAYTRQLQQASIPLKGWTQ